MSTIEEILKKVDKKDPGLLYTGGSINNLTVPKIPSGIFIFDYLTRGGIPEGRITLFHGRKSTCKSTHSLRIAGQYQKIYPDKYVILVDFEHAYDPDWGSKFITDPDKFVLVRPDYAEQGIDILKGLLEAEDVGLVIIDSLAMMIPTVEADADASDNFMGLQARVINKMFRKIVPLMSKARREGRPITFILVNQIRSNMGTASAFVSPDVKPGGHMQDFVASLDVKFANKAYKKKGKTTVQATFIFTLVKNRVGLPRMAGEFDMYLADVDGWSLGDIDEAKVVLEYARRHKVIHKEKKKWHMLDGSFDTLADALVALEEDPDYADKVKEELIRQVKESQTIFLNTEGDEEEEEGE